MSWVAGLATTVALLGLAAGGRRIARAMAGDWGLPPFGAGAVALGVMVAGFLVPIGLVGRALSSFDAGLLAAAVAGALLFGLSRRLDRGGVSRAPAHVERAVWVVVALLAALYAYLAWTYQMHDEHAVFGHKSMVEQLRRGVYPPYLPPFPGEEVRYHYGFDVLAGALARGYGFSSDLSIDLVTVAMAIFMALAAAAVVIDAGAVRSAPLGALAIHLGAGLAAPLLMGVEGRHPRCLAQYHHPSCGVELFPTQLLNVFQHPVSVGVPLFLVAALLLPRLAGGFGQRGPRPGSRAWGGLALLALALMAGLSLGQLVYYALGALAALAALPLWLLWGRRGGRLFGALGLVGVLLASLGLAKLMGGMLAPSTTVDPGLLVRRLVLGFPEKEGLRGILFHHAVNLGIGFVLLLPIALAAPRRRRPGLAMLLAFALGGIAVAHIWSYTRSWDIVKFPSAAAFALSLLYVAVVDGWLAERAGVAWVWLRRGGAALLLGTGLTAALFVTSPLEGPLRLYEPGKWEADPLVAQAIAAILADGYRSEEVVLAQSNVGKELSVFGGLSVIAEDSDLWYMGVGRDQLYERRAQNERARRTLDPEALRTLGVGWLVFSDEELANLGVKARQVLADPPPWLREVASFEGERPGRRRRVWRVELAPR